MTPRTANNEEVPQSVPQKIAAKDLAEYPPNDEGNAQAVLVIWPQRMLYTSSLGWLWFNGRHWQRNQAEALVNRAIVETLKARGKAAYDVATSDNPQTALIRATIPNARRKNSTRDQLRDIVTVDESTFDQNPDLINCENGVLNLRTGQLVPHNAAQRFTYCLPVPYIPGAYRKNGAKWRGFLRSSIGGGDDAIYFLQKSVGYSITGHTREEKFFYCSGVTRGGKGTFGNTILAMLGSPLSMGLSFSTFTANRTGDTQNFDLAGLKPSRFISASESGKYQKLNEAVVKTITGGDPIRASFKGKDAFYYFPQFKIWLFSNFPVNMDVDDDAAWARVVTFSFPNSHLGKEDKTLKQDLAMKDNLIAVLDWAVEGAKAWYKEGLLLPEVVKTAVRADRDSFDYIGQFIDEYYEIITDKDEIKKKQAWIKTRAVYETYAEWCEGEGLQKKNLPNFVKSLKKRGCTTGRKSILGTQERCLIGLHAI